MLALPWLTVVDLDFVISLFEKALLLDRDRKPDRAVYGLDLVAVVKTVDLVLHAVEQHEHIGKRDLVKIAKPGKISRLMGRQDHLMISRRISRISKAWSAPNRQKPAA